jgi:xanthine dehydrogenase accessory factor
MLPPAGDVRVVVQGGGEMGSAAARLLYLAGFPLLILERAAPLAVRRRVCFAEAVFRGRTAVEGVTAQLVAGVGEAEALADAIPVLVDPEGGTVARWRTRVLVDARMAKRNLGTHREAAPFVIGLGPGFTAGLDVHAVIETQRGPDLGRVLWSGASEPDSGLPSAVLGYTEQRVLRAPVRGTFRARRAIGDVVRPGVVVGDVEGQGVVAQVPGVVRGLLEDGVSVGQGIKVGDIDPRGPATDPARISDKARAIAAGVLEAVLLHLRP